jgi:hypothetical protein
LRARESRSFQISARQMRHECAFATCAALFADDVRCLLARSAERDSSSIDGGASRRPLNCDLCRVDAGRTSFPQAVVRLARRTRQYCHLRRERSLREMRCAAESNSKIDQRKRSTCPTGKQPPPARLERQRNKIQPRLFHPRVPRGRRARSARPRTAAVRRH